MILNGKRQKEFIQLVYSEGRVRLDSAIEVFDPANGKCELEDVRAVLSSPGAYGQIGYFGAKVSLLYRGKNGADIGQNSHKKSSISTCFYCR